MFSHIMVGTNDLDRSKQFYDAVLGELNLERHSDFPDEEEEDADIDAVAYGRPGADPVLWVVAGTAPTMGAHIAFAALCAVVLSVAPQAGSVTAFPDRGAQAKGRNEAFANYRLRIAGVIRDYGMIDRAQAPKDSLALHG